MSKLIHIRNVPDAIHRKLEERAAMEGKSLSEFLLAEIRKLAALPTREKMRARLRARTRVELGRPAAEIIREERDSR